jgi:hypothetical protein
MQKSCARARTSHELSVLHINHPFSRPFADWHAGAAALPDGHAERCRTRLHHLKQA